MPEDNPDIEFLVFMIVIVGLIVFAMVSPA